LYEVDAFRLTELRPDLIVTQSQCDICAVSYDDVMTAVRQSPQLASARVFSLNPKSLDDVFKDMRRLAAAVAIDDGAAQIMTALQNRIRRIRDFTTPLQSTARPRVAIIEWLDPLMLAGNWVPQLLEIAGGQCSLTSPSQHSQYRSWEELLQWNPEVIVISPCGFDLQRGASEAKALRERPEWQKLAAVKTQRVFLVDGNACFNRPGPRLVETVELLAALLHPNQLPIPAELKSLYLQFL
jgi:iron complex transport system substrate-binding protein